MEKVPWAFLPKAQSGYCARHGVESKIFSFPAMHSLFMVYPDVVSEFLNLPFEQRGPNHQGGKCGVA